MSFGYRKPVLRDLSVAFRPGRVCLVLGPNGSGKTTLLRLLLGLIDPGRSFAGAPRGRCTLSGREIRSLPPRVRARHMAYVPHRPHVGYAYTLGQYVSFSQSTHRSDMLAVRRALEAVELCDLADVPMHELSAGQMQRASIARAVAQIRSSDAEPRFLLADEPTSALDPRHVTIVLALFGSLAREGVGVVMTMHDLTGAGPLADDVCVLSDQGTLAAAGTPADVLVPEVLEGVFRTRFSVLESQGRRIIIRQDPAAADASPVTME
ncbi:MAG: heme ABC transporter ATP-binding protein [Phycisphaerales bacterium]